MLAGVMAERQEDQAVRHVGLCQCVCTPAAAAAAAAALPGLLKTLPGMGLPGSCAMSSNAMTTIRSGL
jgi:hypothetical protein